LTIPAAPCLIVPARQGRLPRRPDFELVGERLGHEAPDVHQRRGGGRMLSPASELAFRRIYQAHFRQIAAFARRRLNDDEADDVVAETFLIAWRRLDQIPDGPLALLWLYAVARRVVGQQYRSTQRRGRLVTRLAGLAGEDHPNVGAGLEHQAVHEALARLRPPDQEILRLAEWEDLPPRDIAVVLGCSANAASIRLHRAHRRFEQALRDIEAPVEIPPRQEQAT
jgi:RNA polymerase sigma factor (sigma-70 family)